METLEAEVDAARGLHDEVDPGCWRAASRRRWRGPPSARPAAFMPPAARCPPTPRARRALPRPHPTALFRCADADPAPRARPVLVPPSFEDARAFFANPVPARGKAYGRHARAIMEELEQEQVALRSARRKYELPEINSGDVVKVTYYESLTDKTESSFQGIVLGLFNKGVMQSVELRNVVDGVPLVRPPPPIRSGFFLGLLARWPAGSGGGNRRR